MPARSPAVASIPRASVKAGDPMILVGTMKGAFLVHSNPARKRWTVRGPFFPGHAIYAMAYDNRGGRHRLWAAMQSMHWGAVLCSSDDFGEHWNIPDAPSIQFPAS